MTGGKQPLCKTRKVCMEGQRSGIFGSNNRTRRVLNGEEKGGGSYELANTAVC